jgi:cell division septal protein FtsQ
MIRHFPKLLFVFSLLLLGAGYGLTQYPVITLRTVEITGTDRIAEESLPVSLGQNVLDINLRWVLNAVIVNTFVESASAKIDHRGKLAISVVEKTPVAYVYLGNIYAVTERGELIPTTTVDTIMSLPVIQGVKMDTVRCFQIVNSPGLREAIKLLRIMRRVYPRTYAELSEVLVSGPGLSLIFEPGSVVINLGWGAYEKKIEHVERILADNKNPGLDLDLRFVDLAIMKTRVSNREVNDGI